MVVTGGAGFIGSCLVDRLLREGHEVVVIDNLSSGNRDFLSGHGDRLDFRHADVLGPGLAKHLKGADEVWHFAANPDVKIGAEDTRIHIEQNVIATNRVLEALMRNRIKRLYFTSTSTVYGEADQIPTREDYSPLEPISMYGASKLACEAMISSYCHCFGIQAVVYRLANVIGMRSGKGVIHDFIQKLRHDPARLEILGDGKQNKSYVYIDDCIDAMMLARLRSKLAYDVFNIGSPDQLSVNRIAEIVSAGMGLHPSLHHTGGKRGWVGDVPVMLLDTGKLRKMGWRARHKSEGAVRLTVDECLKGRL